MARGWLVLQLTNSAFAVGLVTTLGSLPILLFTLYGGVVADRVNKHRLVLILQALMLLEALALGILLTQLHLITVHWVMGLAVFFGLLARVRGAHPAGADLGDRGRDDLMNAIALNSSAFNVARVVGPAIAGGADRDGGARGLLLRQRGQLPRGGRGPADDADGPSASSRPRRRRSRRCAKASATCSATGGPGRW